jgi:hypothetical protein
VKKILLLAFFGLYCAAANAQIVVEKAFVREMPPGQAVTAAFMTLQNTGTEPARLLSVSSDSAERVEIHMHRHNNGMMRMEQVESITVPAGAVFTFEPGAYHLMLVNITRPLVEGDNVQLKLEFNHAEQVTVDLPVQNIMREHH